METINIKEFKIDRRHLEDLITKEIIYFCEKYGQSQVVGLNIITVPPVTSCENCDRLERVQIITKIK